MPLSFVLINCDLGKEQEITRDLRKIENVKEVYFVYGVYDFIVKVEAETTEKINDTTREIRHLENIRSTLTMMVVT